ncbi:MAG: FAD:protein FMN transferase [Planctomycetes bacterium]|nr:FAD:protein FMN transferase [Planctomycetota bacterium]
MRYISLLIAVLIVINCNNDSTELQAPHTDIVTLEMSFGAENLPEEFILSRPTDVNVNNDGDIFVADEKAEDASALAAAVFREVDRLERDLSRFLEGSDVFRINHTKLGERIRIGPEVFECLQLAMQITQWTRGKFDITFGSKILGDNDLLSLNKEDLSVEVLTSGLHVDLGGIGKGFTLDRVSELIEDWQMTRCLIHGGGSSILALDPPDGYSGWPVGVGEGPHRTLLSLRRQGLGASGTEVKGEHIIDTKKKRAGRQSRQTWSIAANAGLSDALSTAFMLMRPEEIDTLCDSNDGVGAAIRIYDSTDPGRDRFLKFGTWPNLETSQALSPQNTGTVDPLTLSKSPEMTPR